MYIIEAMTEADISEVSRLERRCFSNPWPQSAYRRELRRPAQNCYIVLRNTGSDGNEPAIRDGSLFSIGSRLTTLARARRNDRADSRAPIVGFSGFWHLFEEAHITTIGIDPSLRGQSLGELLLVAMIEEAIARGAGYLSLEVRISNSIAMRLYEKYDFSIKGTRPRYYVDDGEDAYVMWSPSIRTESFRQMLDQRREELAYSLGEGAVLPEKGQFVPVEAPTSGNGTA